MEMQKRNYKNNELKVEINCYGDKKNQIWFHGKEIALILGYKNTRQAIINNVHIDDKKLIEIEIESKEPQKGGLCDRPPSKLKIKCFFVNESGFYSLISSSKKPLAREFKHLVTSKVLPSIRKYGYDSKSNKLIIESEYDLHSKVVSFIRNKYNNALIIAGLGENQKPVNIRLSSYKKGYMAGQCDLMIMNPTSKHNSLCIEFQSPTGSYQISKKTTSYERTL